MIIEFTGCSGAGKTVLREAVVRELARRGQQATCSITALLGPRWSRLRNWPRLGNLILDILVLPKYILTQSLREKSPHFDFRQHCQQAIAKNSNGFFSRLRLLRSMIRKLALDHHLRNKQTRLQAVLVDEGIIHLAQILHGRNIYENDAVALDINELRTFVALAPHPDLLVWVKAPLELLERRIAKRNTHQPLPGQSASNRRKFLRRSDALLSSIACDPRHTSWILPIENHQQNLNDLEYHAKHVADAIGKLSHARHPEHALTNQQPIHAA